MNFDEEETEELFVKMTELVDRKDVRVALPAACELVTSIVLMTHPDAVGIEKFIELFYNQLREQWAKQQQHAVKP